MCEKSMNGNSESKTSKWKKEQPKGCELCNKPEKWAAVFGHEYRFGFPYLFARKQFFEDGKIKAAFCPMCGRPLNDSKEG